MTVFSSHDVRACLRQCVTCFGHGRILYIGAHAADALDFLLTAGTDPYALSLDADGGAQADHRFVPDRLEAASVTAPALDIARRESFDAAIVVLPPDSLAAEAATWLRLIAEAGIRNAALVTPVAQNGTDAASAVETKKQAFELGFRIHARLTFARLTRPLPPLGGYEVCAFERAANASTEQSSAPAEDILRHTDPASQTAVAEFTQIDGFVRAGDAVLVLDNTAGSGAYVVAQNSAARHVLGIVPEASRCGYASAQYGEAGRVDFKPWASEALHELASHSFDVVICRDVRRFAPLDWPRLADIVRPGGRLILGLQAPQRTGDASVELQSPVELLRSTAGSTHASWLPECAFISPPGVPSDVAWRKMALDERLVASDGHVIVVSMRDPVGADASAFVDTMYQHADSPAFNVLPDGRGMVNPWLFRSMVTIGTRMNNDAELGSLQARVLEQAPHDTADYGAALCGHAYRVLAARASTDTVRTCVAEIQAYLDTNKKDAQHLRWSISQSYVAAKLLQAIGDLEGAEAWALKCAAMDPVPFSPLLATKTVAALDLAASFAVGRRDYEAARQYLERAVQEVQRVLSGDWVNILGDTAKPLGFGLPEVSQLAELGARCAYLLNYLADAEYRPGLVWREHRGFYERVFEVKDTQIEALLDRNAFLYAETQRLEDVARHMQGEAERLEGVIRQGKDEEARLEGLIQAGRIEADRLEGVIREKDRDVAALKQAAAADEAEKARLAVALKEQVLTSEALRVAVARTLKARFLRAARALSRRFGMTGRTRQPAPAAWPPAPVPAPVKRFPNAPLLLNERRVAQWLAQFDSDAPHWASSQALASVLPASERGAGDLNADDTQLKIIAAADLRSLGPQAPGVVIVVVFTAGDNPYALRSDVYDHVDLCIALDHHVFLGLALLHPMVIEATPANVVDSARRFWKAINSTQPLIVPDAAAFNPSVAPVVMLQVDSFMVGGLERVVFDLLDRLGKAGFQPMLGFTSEIATEAEAELKERQFDYVRLPGDPAELRAVLVERKVALVNAHYSLSLSEVCASLKIPFVQTVHNMYMWLDAAGKEQWRRVDEVTDAYICVSANVAMFADVNLRLSADRMIVVPNGCDSGSAMPLLEPERDLALREELGFPADSPVFVNVASINPVKGQGLLIDAFAIAHAKRPDIRLVILGKHSDAGYAARLQERIAHHGLQGVVSMPGYRSDVYRFVDLARAVVMPSFTEGWSLAISETLQRNAPVIATDVGGAREQLIGEASTVIRAYRDDWSTLDGAEFYQAIANEWELHAVRDELARTMVEHAERPVRQPRESLQQSFQSMTPTEAYTRHAEIFAAILTRTNADCVRYASYLPQRQSRYFKLTDVRPEVV
ncbi:glycosyltransferase involved in cell wall biosynthesis [Paraburkholderia sp. BL27I4N3]|uniref:glycosyltransferase n=1 Tax=Paraburkholderia sp. BL27I4N3 TaxID=1938805 RepID=UPI000E362749|nr:glycosyltransferase [Paraburkholderia sp. BL27I4N3]REE20127.1 glycosyltransferase involved in cell wall biosynthesis [Paraburkholderia sp. BL27I4N3]